MEKRVLITGATGGIGKNLAKIPIFGSLAPHSLGFGIF